MINWDSEEINGIDFVLCTLLGIGIAGIAVVIGMGVTLVWCGFLEWLVKL